MARQSAANSSRHRLSILVHQILAAQAVLARKTIIANDVQSDPHYLTTFGSTQSEIIVPVIASRSGKVVGTVDVESEQRDAFSIQEQQALEKFAWDIQGLWEQA